MTQQSPPQNHTVRNIVIGVLAAVIGCVVCSGIVFAVAGASIVSMFSGVVTETKAMGDSANALLTDLRNNDYRSAYARLDETSQMAYGGNAEAFQAAAAAQGFARPTDWQLNNFNITNNVGTVSGTVTVNGSSIPITFQLRSVNGQWKISAVSTGE
jgi:hypothetical protein